MNREEMRTKLLQMRNISSRKLSSRALSSRKIISVEDTKCSAPVLPVNTKVVKKKSVRFSLESSVTLIIVPKEKELSEEEIKERWYDKMSYVRFYLDATNAAHEVRREADASVAALLKGYKSSRNIQAKNNRKKTANLLKIWCGTTLNNDCFRGIENMTDPYISEMIVSIKKNHIQDVLQSQRACRKFDRCSDEQWRAVRAVSENGSFHLKEFAIAMGAADSAILKERKFEKVKRNLSQITSLKFDMMSFTQAD